MNYTLMHVRGTTWRIIEDESSYRWILQIQRGDVWEKVASYSTPAAAAMAVAGGDTGVTEWDGKQESLCDFDLKKWQWTV